MTLLDDMKEKYDSLPSKKKQVVLTGGILLSAFLVFYFSVNSGNDDDAAGAPKAKPSDSLTLSSGLMEDTLRESVRAETDAMKERMAGLETLVEDLIRRLDQDNEAIVLPLPVDKDDIELEGEKGVITEADLAPANELADLLAPSAPRFPPAVLPNTLAADGEQPTSLDTEPNVPVVIGSIGGVKPAPAPAEPEENVRQVYLPVGMMEAVLLTGLDALVGNQAQSNPEPILARVQTPAVLPNDVRANLKGCFVVGNGIGILAKERVDIRAVSLSCVDDSERTVIDQPIKGYFVDTDGKKGLSGNVVTRDGAIVGRAFATGVLDGFGQVAQASAGTQSISPLGSTRIFDTEEAVVAGVGQGIGNAAQTLSEYYLDLAKTVSPVIEVGTQKRAVLVIQEGVYLEIKEVKNVAGN